MRLVEPCRRKEEFAMKSRYLRAVLGLLAACAAALGTTLVVPTAQATTAGNMPIRLGTGAARIQEVIGTGQFTGPITIIALRVRAAPGTGSLSTASGPLRVMLSTTQAYPNTSNGHTLPSIVYASNVGPDATLVYNANAGLSSPGCALPGPCPFDTVIHFMTPFSYDPSKGRLLIDYISSAAPAGTSTGSLDGVTFPDSTNSPVAVVAGDPTQASGSSVGVGGIVFGLDTGAGYYFSDLAFKDGWQMTLTYNNYSPQAVTCVTNFYGDSGAPLLVPFSQGTVSTRTDVLQPGASIHEQTVANPAETVVQGWAQAICTGPVQASELFRLYKSGVPVGEASVNAETAPTTEFATFAQNFTGVAYANPSTTQSATITFTVYDNAGTRLASQSITVGPLAHGSANLGPLLGLPNFTGFVKITSTIPIISLSLNFEAPPIFSSLPPGDLPSSTVLVTP